MAGLAGLLITLLVGPDHDPSKNEAWMGDMQFSGPGWYLRSRRLEQE